MKRKFSIIICCLVIAVANINAQTMHKKFRVDAGIGYAIPDNGGGLLISVEPRYAVSERINAGLRWERDFIMKEFNEGNTTSAKSQYINSYLVTGDFYLFAKKFRPFVGTGLGVYKIAAVDAVTTGGNGSGRISGKTNFGGLLRAGVDVSHFRLALAYSLTGKDGNKNKSGFFNISVGAYLGGGIKKSE
jgi:hypothetical protein